MVLPLVRYFASSCTKFVTGFAERFKRSPITSVEALEHFLQTRSAYIAQTSLYGYLKTRMGTRFPEFFQDQVFAEAIRNASAQIFVSCLSDLTVFAVITSGAGQRLGSEQAAALSRHCYRNALERGLADLKGEAVPSDALAEFDRRLAEVEWRPPDRPEDLFTGSGRDLLRFAPVVDEFKALDREIVQNSIRFRWRDVREQLRTRLNGDAVLEDWRHAQQL